MNRCYYFSQDAVTFDEAYNYCLARNSLIVSISHNSSEANFVEKSIKSKYYCFINLFKFMYNIENQSFMVDIVAYVF